MAICLCMFDARARLCCPGQERLAALCSPQDLCSWPAESIGAFFKGGTGATITTRVAVFLNYRMYVMMAIFTAARVHGLDLMSRLDDRRRVAEVLCGASLTCWKNWIPSRS